MIFIVKYDRRGVLRWARQESSNSFAEGSGIAVNRSGEVYVTGRFFGESRFGEEPNETVLSSDGGAHSFVAKYTNEGALLWARQIVGTTNGFNEARGIAVDRAGNSYVVGWFQGTITLGPGEMNETTFTEPGGRNSFIAKYDGDGALVWARQADTPFADGARSVAVDSGDNTYVTGSFGAISTFGLGEPEETKLVRVNGVAPGFVIKLDGDGRLAWARQGGGFAVAVDDKGGTYVTGSFLGGTPPQEIGLTFAVGEPNETTLISAGRSDIFIEKISERHFNGESPKR